MNQMLKKGRFASFNISGERRILRLGPALAKYASASNADFSSSSIENIPKMEHSTMRPNAPQRVIPQSRINGREGQFGIAHFCNYPDSSIEPAR